MSGEVADAAHGLADGAERRLVAIRPGLAVPGDARDHQRRIRGVQRLRSQRQALQPAGAEVLHQHVGARREAQHDVAIALQVQHDRHLVAAVHAEPHRVPIDRRTPAAERVAARRLDLDYLGAQIGENAGAERRCDVVSELQYLEADQWPGARRWGLHPALSFRVPALVILVGGD
jgi:hypothetical protein